MSKVEFEVRRISVRRTRWEGLWSPVGCWLRNRWNWRMKRRVRADVRRWESLVVPLEELAPVDDPAVQRMAEMAEGLGYSDVLQYGYGSGEAVVVAHHHEPERLRPFIVMACGFTLAQLTGSPHAGDVEAAVGARNRLLSEVRDIVASHPKSPTAQP